MRSRSQKPVHAEATTVISWYFFTCNLSIGMP
nr:MAG TPA: hypothetical protein [Caudoviricetes sp.]